MYKMLWLGLTGGLGTGKTTVAELIRQQGFQVIDADQIAKQALGPGEDVAKKVIQVFGPGILNSENNIDREKLAGLVFKNKSKLELLESLVHPFVQQKVSELRELAQTKGEVMAFYDVPLLFEKHLERQFDGVIVVSANQEIQLDRIKKRNQWSKEQIESRLANQLPLKDKELKSDYVIYNNGTLSDLKKDVIRMIQNFKERKI